MSNIKLAFGYDIEKPYGHFAETKEGEKFRQKQLKFIKKLSELLNKENIPRTFFILGDYLKKCLNNFSKDELKAIYYNDNLNEIQQHSYSHIIFKEIKNVENRQIFTPSEFIDDVKKANIILKDILDINPTGLRTPLGYSKDLSDNPIIVENLSKLGFSYISSNLRSDELNNGKLTHERQPHTYQHIGYSKIIEIPSQGWQDTIFTSEKAKKYLNKNPFNSEEIFKHYNSLFEKAIFISKGKPIYISLCLHPWAIMEYDPKLEIHKRLINSAKEKNIEFVSYGKIAKEILNS